MAGHDSTTTSSGARQDAQRRADQISAFGRELAELERDGVVTLRPEDRVRIERHHADLLATLTRQFDVDRTESQRQMTLGMRVASLIGAVTLSAGIVLFFYQFWGLMTTPVQITVLAATPLVALLAVEVAARRAGTDRDTAAQDNVFFKPVHFINSSFYRSIRQYSRCLLE